MFVVDVGLLIGIPVISKLNDLLLTTFCRNSGSFPLSNLSMDAASRLPYVGLQMGVDHVRLVIGFNAALPHRHKTLNKMAIGIRNSNFSCQLLTRLANSEPSVNFAPLAGRTNEKLALRTNLRHRKAAKRMLTHNLVDIHAPVCTYLM